MIVIDCDSVIVDILWGFFEAHLLIEQTHKALQLGGSDYTDDILSM